MVIKEILDGQKERFQTSKEKLNVSVNNINTLNTKGNTNSYRIVEVQQTAHKLADQLNNPGSFKFYCKMAWRLPEHKIWSNLEQALTGRDPKKYFSWLCTNT